MSGFRGTIGNPKDDPIAAWFYDKLEGAGPDMVKAIFKFIHSMNWYRNNLTKLEDKAFRENTARLVRDDFFLKIEQGFLWAEPAMKTRLRNLATRNYRQAIGAGRSAPVCGWCQKGIMMQQPFKLRNGGKMHYKCATAFDKA